MKSMVSLWVACLEEAGNQYYVRTARDLAYALSRFEHEGLSFFTLSLPAFEKSFLEAISTGGVRSDHFAGFRRSGGLPAFMSGFLLGVFDRSGLLRQNVDPRLVQTIRQVLLLLSKLELPCTEERRKAAFDAYVSTDAGLEDLVFPEELLSEFQAVGLSLFQRAFNYCEAEVYSNGVPQNHSSGTTADRVSYNQRFASRVWTERLNYVHPWWHDLAVSWRESASDVRVLPRNEEPPVRVTSVPKTMKGPRIIAMEPNWMMFVQQGYLRLFEDGMRKHANWREFGWLDQEPNRLLSRYGSVDGSFATLDLSEASDRVSLRLVERLFHRNPFLWKGISAARTEKALMPDGRVVRLNKFASMGSAVCFPIETLVFTTIVEMAYRRVQAAIGPDRAMPQPFGLRYRVYGDDLIVPTQVARELVGLLEALGLKVNTRKSFTTGPFRESCGADWFNGSDVTVRRVRHVLPTSNRQYQGIEQAIDLHNSLFSRGWFEVAAHVERLLMQVDRRIGYGPINVPGPILWTYDTAKFRLGMDRYQRPSVKSIIFRHQKPADPLTGYGALSKFYLNEGINPRDKTHLERDGRSRYAGTHTGWIPITF